MFQIKKTPACSLLWALRGLYYEMGFRHNKKNLCSSSQSNPSLSVLTHHRQWCLTINLSKGRIKLSCPFRIILVVWRGELPFLSQSPNYAIVNTIWMAPLNKQEAICSSWYGVLLHITCIPADRKLISRGGDSNVCLPHRDRCSHLILIS